MGPAHGPSIACLAWICSLIIAAASSPTFAYDWQQWFDPATAPFIPIPQIDTDPDSGRTFGIMPTWLHTGADGSIDRIVAPVVYKNSYFGWGIGFNVYAYPSQNVQWWVDGEVEERVERQVDYNYLWGLERQSRWSFAGRLLYDRDGTPRFFGVGNETSRADETNYTNQAEMLQVMPGWNLSRQLQIDYMLRAESEEVTTGDIPGVLSIQRRFGANHNLGTFHAVINRLMLVFDTRNSLNLPTRGLEVVGYEGLASRRGFLDQSLYNEAGGDVRAYLPIGWRTVMALHSALRYELNAQPQLPFWTLSTVGGDSSVIGGEQEPLRGFGQGRFSDRDSSSFSIELRHTVADLNVQSSEIQVQLAPFWDAGRVFGRPSTNPLTQLHNVFGVGLRGVAPPNIVGYVDVGDGSEGVAVFTGINYPF